jgi:uncharacterized protein
MSDRAPVFEWLLQPGTGKAVEVLAGHVLRIAQVEGHQCADFNCFNLHDYKEYMHCGRTRTVHGFHPSKGDFLWSAPPRERAMMYILEDTYGRNDVLFPRCSAYVYESAYGFDVHTNCQDIQAEAQREYGLTPDDVHDSFNLFMCTEVTGPHGATMTRQNSKPGDHVDLLALIDVLAVPNVCGSDVMRTSNFSLRPLQLSVFKATETEMAAVPRVRSLLRAAVCECADHNHRPARDAGRARNDIAAAGCARHLRQRRGGRTSRHFLHLVGGAFPCGKQRSASDRLTTLTATFREPLRQHSA